MAAATKRRKMFLPPAPAIVVVQPPEHLAHLEGDALYQALISDESEKWYSARTAAECGRTPETFRGWVSNRYKYNEDVKAAQALAERTGQRVKQAKRPTGRMMADPSDYDGRSPWWYPGTARKWFIAEGLMDRRGVFIPYKPPGRLPGSANTKPRTSPQPMQSVAAEVLDAYDALLAAGVSKTEARARLAAERGESERQIDRKLTTGRKLRIQHEGLQVTAKMTAEEVDERVRKARQVLATDGRRSNEDKIRDAIAERLGIDRAAVDRALGPVPAAAEQT